jgi:hypothetical protein
LSILSILATASKDLIQGSVDQATSAPVDGEPVIASIINMAIFAVGTVAVVSVVVGGVMYSTSQGDTAKIKKAKDTIMYAIIGVIVAVLAYAIVNFALSGIFRGSSGGDTGDEDDEISVVIDLVPKRCA